MEIELKLLIAPAAVGAFRRHPLLKKLAIAKPYRQQLVSTYFDTPDCYLMQHQAGLRVRQVEGKWIQTLKAGGQVESGLHQRNEWESEVIDPTPDLAVLRGMLKPKSPWARLIARPGIAQQLTPIFTTRFQRSVWLLRLPQGDQVELVLDQGEIQHGSGADATRSPISEIELELKSGNAAHLFAFALELQDKLPLRVGNVSKAERGYQLYAPRPLQIIKARAFELSAKETVSQGLQAIMANCLAQIQGNEAGLAFGTDAESVHQMHIGVRRLRSAIALFSGQLPLPDLLIADVKWLGRELGVVRDWEVFAGTTLDALARGCQDGPDLQPLRQKAADFASESRVKAAEAVGSTRYARLMLTLGACMHGAMPGQPEPAPASKELEAPLRKFASEQLARYQKKLRKRGKGLARSDSAERHQLRIAAKKVRYAIEFFHSLYPAKQVKSYVAALSALQDALGELNDASVTHQLLQQCVHGAPELAEASGFVRGYVFAHNEKNLEKLTRLWKKFKLVNPPLEK